MALFGLASKISKTIGLGEVGAAGITFGIDAALTYPTYTQDRKNGHGFVYSAAHAVGSTILMNEFMLPTIALTLAPLAGVAHQAYTNSVGNMQRNILGQNPVLDSAQAQTSRQRSLRAIAQARMSARNALGNEAGLYAPRFR